MYDILVLGGGPAGLTAAVYLARKQVNCLLISENLGGQVLETLRVENYMGYQFIEGPELMDKFQTQIAQYPLEKKIGVRVVGLRRWDNGFEVETESGDTFRSKVVIYVLGKRARELNVPGEKRLRGRGVTYCAICDGPVFSGERVAVVGGGNSALEAVYDLTKIAQYIYLISLTQLTADAILIERVSVAPNLTILVEHVTEEIEGEKQVEAIWAKDLKTGERKRLEVGGVFVEIGLVPNSEPIRPLVQLNQWGEVPVTMRCETGVPGLYAAGDVTDVPEKQIVVACGEGAKAALQAHRYLQRL